MRSQSTDSRGSTTRSGSQLCGKAIVTCEWNELPEALIDVSFTIEIVSTTPTALLQYNLLKMYGSTKVQLTKVLPSYFKFASHVYTHDVISCIVHVAYCTNNVLPEVLSMYESTSVRRYRIPSKVLSYLRMCFSSRVVFLMGFFELRTS